MWLAGHPQIGVYAVYIAGFIVLGELLIDLPRPSQAVACAGWSLGALLPRVIPSKISLLCDRF